MAYWICVTSEENWSVIRAQHVWGVSERWKNIISHVSKGDLLVFYVVPKRIGGIFEVISDPYYDDSQIFHPVRDKEEKFPYRIKLEPILVLEKPKDFTPLISRLSFIKNKLYWSGPLRRAMFRINEEDFKIIEEYLKRSS